MNLERNAEFEALELLNDMPFWEVERGVNFCEFLTYEGFPLWWIVHPIVSRDFLLVFREALRGGKGGGCAARKVPGWPFRLTTDPLIGDKLGLRETSPRGFRRLLAVEPAYRMAVWALRYGAEALYDVGLPISYRIRELRAGTRGVVPKMRPDGPLCLVVTHTRTWGVLGWGRKGDTVLGPVLQRLRDLGFGLVGVEVEYYGRTGVATLRERAAAGSWFPYEAFYGAEAREAYRRARNEFCSLDHRLRSSRLFRSRFQIAGRDCFPIVEERIRLVARRLAPHAVRLLSMTRSMIRRFSPDVVLMAYETGPVGRTVSAVARAAGIPTIGVQHGRIHSLHHHYVQRSPRDQDARQARLLPDVTAVFGPQAQRVLVDYGGYPEDGVRVTGQPRTDLLLAGVQTFDRRKFLADHALRPDKPLILVATQNFPRREDRERVLDVVLGDPELLHRYQFLIKTHPGETDRFVQRYLKRARICGVRVCPDVELYGALAAADVVVTGTSTVGIEALLFQKPVITVGGLPSPLPLADVGAALEVNSSRDFREALVSLLQDEACRSRLRDMAADFVRQEFYELDGRASERVAQIVLELLSHRNRKGSGSV